MKLKNIVKGFKDPINETDDSYKIALDLVGLNARKKVFKKHKVGKYDSDLSYEVIQDAITILKRLL
jgi:hypothetical protein